MSKEEAIKELTELLPEEFLSEYSEALDMAIKALEQQSTDAVDRQAVIRIAEQGQVQDYERQFKELVKLPSISPQLKIGHWIEDINGTYTDNHDTWRCSECGHAQILLIGTPIDNDYNYCPNCGCKMQEVEE